MTELSSNTFKPQTKNMVRIPIREYMKIGTGSDQWNRNEISIKTSSTGKVKDIRDTSTTIN